MEPFANDAVMLSEAKDLGLDLTGIG
jgi:hypothetical protein